MRARLKKNKDALEFEETLSLDPFNILYGALGEYLAVDAKYPEQLHREECGMQDCHHWCRVDCHNASSSTTPEDGDEDTIRICDESIGDKYNIQSVVHHIGSLADQCHYTANVMKQSSPNKKKRD